ncbi:MAG: orotidine-5'-phosphate decarboxylase [Patescibacteria group bacterium]|jgi:orotidine-5'-phosphate decarboxylase
MTAAEIGFRKRLAAQQISKETLVCVGLDPMPEKLPVCFSTSSNQLLAQKVATWMKDIVFVTAHFGCMFKLQSAHWEAIPGGREAMQEVIQFIKKEFPYMPVFLDCKRGDIGRTQERYRVAHFNLDGVDGMNFSPYMGKDCMEFLVDKSYPGRAIVGLCYTSNPSAREVQNLLIDNRMPLWEVIAIMTFQWAKDLGILENAGLVMAAAYEEPKGSGHIYDRHLIRCREIVGDKLWFLIPGIGNQGGFIEQTVKAAYIGPGSIAINSSSDIIFASTGEDYAQAAVNKAKALRDAIRATMPK